MKKKNSKNKILILFIIITLISILSIYSLNLYKNNNIGSGNNKDENVKDIKTSAFLATLNLTNSFEIDGNMYPIGTSIRITGIVYKEFPYTPLSGVDVTLKIDNQLRLGYTATSNISGEFTINYIIESSLNVYQSHIVEVQVTDPLYPILSDVYYPNNYIIDVNSTSYFSVIKGTTSYLPQEQITDLSGNLFFGNGSSGIPNSLIMYLWYNATHPNIGGIMGTITSSNGEIPSDITVPFNIYAGLYDLYIYFPSIYGVADSSSINITGIEIFRDLTCIWWDTSNPINVEEGQNVQISGKIVDSNDILREFKNRRFQLFDDSNYINTVTTDINGDFSDSYIIPGGLGPKTISIQIIASSSIFTFSNTNIPLNVSQPTIPPPFGIPLTPLQWFFIIGVPIIGAVIAVIGYYGYKRFNNRLIASQTIVIPLEQRIKNLKILKDSGRIEEALSYLFNSIYIELVSKKYGRIKKPNETIRDFAIISVKEFNLEPSKIYPFIQKVEEIIYARPYQVADKEFYETIELFSPIYYYLTGSTFILNF